MGGGEPGARRASGVGRAGAATHVPAPRLLAASGHLQGPKETEPALAPVRRPASHTCHWGASVSASVRQGIVLAAGRGTRLYPISGLIPKPLLPVCNKPIMQYQLEAMRDAGIREVAIVLGP